MSHPLTSDTLQSKLDELFEMERLALERLIASGAYLFLDATSPNQPRRKCESINGDHSVYRVDIKGVQIYLDEMDRVAERFSNLNLNGYFPSENEIPHPKADLRFLEIVGENDFPLECDEMWKLTSRSSIDLFHTKFTSPTILFFEGRNNLLSMNGVHSLKSFEILVNDSLHIDIDLTHARFDGELIIGSHPARTGRASVTFNSSSADICRFLCGRLTFNTPKFTGTSFRDKAEFHNISFEEYADFRRVKLSNGALFDRCDFSRAPDFHDAELHQNTVFQKCNFETKKCSVVDVSSFRLLKVHYGKMRDTKHELNFYALEHRAERISTKNGIMVSILSWLYDEVSEYGASIEKTVFTFIYWNLDFFLIFLWVTSSQRDSQLIKVSNETLSTYPALMLTFQNIFNPLALFSGKSLVSVNNLAVYMASLLQGLGSIAILALMLFAIRGRFRKGSSSES
ncbi:MAG: pentapeptide repeat-containing protein [Gammaproteobacteria bacterium]|nr:pentapeptide repeat-containing protein [Gammaproteobacteria bacterium]